MTGNELLRRLRRLARKRGVAFEFDPRTGKGGHGKIILGDRVTALRSSRPKEIPSGTLRKMLLDLGIDPEDLR